ncbi:hypothetical protein I5G58_gp027 [Mycobacterium phage BirdsNest]|uniref:Tail assembly chaperone n=1 Tax=Mycobacterium phage BirdsNest TaxID=2686231 RepID=A0A6B9LJ50_9CAUD|nr:hypothetical protein I5G58_gp027 [Mycobacterium phage BirdsNest]QHB37329.1 hypothetical protein PBI_BIRDSNEST_27 [Mycobacterium phage BirdsNest]
MAKVTIEGSLSPSAYLARGERREVQRDEHVENLIRLGFVNVVDEDGDVEPAPLPEPVKAPSKSASRDDWAEFLAKYTDIVTEGKNRDALQAEYDEWLETHDLPAADAE